MAIVDACNRHSAATAFTVAISGIDASGKGYISQQLYQALTGKGYAVALIHTDPWQNPLPVRLKKENPAANFHENVFRWNDLFNRLILPLKKDKGIYLETTGIRTEADIYYPLIYDLRNIDIILIEGIFLFKQEYLSFYDLTIWTDCSFETGLRRAIQRNAECLDTKTLIHDYHTFYYPAQRYHFKKDHPAAHADFVIDNN